MTLLRPYQTESRHRQNALINSGRHPVYVAPTGTGKTRTDAQVVLDRVKIGQICWILTPQEEIFDQWVIEFARLRADYGTIDSNGIQGRAKKIYVCMPKSLNNMLSRLPESFAPDVIFTDECHHSEADTWQNIYSYYPDATRVGMTATPQRTDGQGLDKTYTDIIETITMQEAIDAGYLAQPLLIVPEQYKIDVPIQNGDFSTEAQAELLGKTQIIGDIITQYGNIFAGLPVLVACSTYEHAKLMTEEFNSAGYNFDHIHSGLAKHERKRMLREIRSGKLNGLCTVGIGIEGMDIPGLHGLIWLRRTLSVTIYLQFIGRVLRPMSGKSYGIILDPVGNVFIHGRPEMPRIWSLKGRSERPAESDAPQMKICPQCKVMNSKDNIECHICGYNFIDGTMSAGSKRGLPCMVDGELVLLDASELGQRQEEIRQKLKAQRDHVPDAGKKVKPKVITQGDKMTLLKSGLEKKSGLFADAVKQYL